MCIDFYPNWPHFGSQTSLIYFKDSNHAKYILYKVCPFTNVTKLEINNRKVSGKYSCIWKVNSHSLWVKEEIKERNQKVSQMNENNKVCQNLWGTVKIVNMYTGKEVSNQQCQFPP